MDRRTRLHWIVKCFCSIILPLTMQAGCGFERIQPSLPDLVQGLTLEQLQQIQNDERLTEAEMRQAIRDAAGIPDTTDGDRLVDFLLNFVVP